MSVAIAAVLVILFLLSAFFSGSETVLFSLTPAQHNRIRERDPKAAKRISGCLEDSALLLSTLLVGNTLVNFAIATLGYRLFEDCFPGRGAVFAIPVMTVALLIFGEITPKQIALRRTETLAPVCARLLLFWRTALTPCNLVLRSVSRVFSAALERERRALSDTELISVLDAACERGEFSEFDAKMAEGILRLSELHANDEMTPRVDMETYDLDLPQKERESALARCRYRYLPVIRRTPDAVEGIYDRLTGEIGDAFFVPETVTLDDLLVAFRRNGRQLAVVLDEYGGTAGMISYNDVLEVIFGPAVFSRPEDEPQIVEIGRNVWDIDARVNLDEINRELGIELDAGDADRLSGWVAFHAERLPKTGERVEADGCRAIILKRRRRRVEMVRLQVLKYPKVGSDMEIIAETDEAVEKTEGD